MRVALTLTMAAMRPRELKLQMYLHRPENGLPMLEHIVMEQNRTITDRRTMDTCTDGDYCTWAMSVKYL